MVLLVAMVKRVLEWIMLPRWWGPSNRECGATEGNQSCSRWASTAYTVDR